MPTPRAKKPSQGTVTASGLSTWKRRPKRGVKEDATVRSLGMGMQATPARKKKASSGTKAGASKLPPPAHPLPVHCPWLDNQLTSLQGSIGLHSTPRAKTSRNAPSTPSKVPDGLPSDTTSSSLPLDSLADPSETFFFAPPPAPVASDDPMPSPSVNAIGPAQEFETTNRQDGRSSGNARVSFDATSDRIDETTRPDDPSVARDMTVPVKFPTSSAPTSEDPPAETHEDFTVPLNDSTRTSRARLPPASPIQNQGLTPRPKSKSAKSLAPSGDTRARSKTPLVSKIQSDWVPKGGSSVHARQSTPYRHRVKSGEVADTNITTTETTASAVLEPDATEQGGSPTTSSRGQGPHQGNQEVLSPSKVSNEERPASGKRTGLSSSPTPQDQAAGSTYTSKGSVSPEGQPATHVQDPGMTAAADEIPAEAIPTDDTPSGEDSDVEIGRSKSRRHGETLTFALGDLSRGNDQIDLDDLDLPAPVQDYSDDDAFSAPFEQGEDLFDADSQIYNYADGPARFMPSSQLDLAHPSVDPGSPISFSPSPSPQSQIITPLTNRQKRDYGYTQSANSPAGSTAGSIKKSLWRGAEALARVDGEFEIDEEPRAKIRRRATKARKEKGVDQDEDEEEGDSVEQGGGPRKVSKRGGIVLEGDAEAARQKRIELYQELDSNYQLRVEYVRLLRR